MSRNVCKISNNNSRLHFVDCEGDELDITIYSNGETPLSVSRGDKTNTVLLTNRAAHELRDFLNRRFPNATAVQ
jgi:hypothetical protein